MTTIGENAIEYIKSVAMSGLVSFGIEEESSLDLGTGSISSIHSINKYEHIVTSTRNLFRVEGKEVKKVYPHSFLASCYIKKYAMIIGYTVHGCELVLLDEHDMGKPMVPNFKTDHTGVFHILYSERSSLLVLVGSGFSVWNFNVIKRGSASIKTEVSITLNCRFAEDYDTSIMNRPVFDYSRELMLLPTRDGVVAFDMKGTIVKRVTSFPCPHGSVIDYDEEHRRVIYFDPTTGVSLWDLDGYNCGNFSVGVAVVLSISFLSDEHVLLMNAKGAVYIFNIKTGKSFHVYKTPSQLSRAIVDRKGGLKVVFTFGSRVVFLKVTIPWFQWAEGIHGPNLICRVPQKDQASRLLVQTGDGFMRLFSPKFAYMVSSAVAKSLDTPSCVTYDRGCVATYKKNKHYGVDGKEEGAKVLRDVFDCEVEEAPQVKDELFVAVSTGVISGFKIVDGSCPEFIYGDTKAAALTSFYHEGRWGYVVGSSRGEALLCDYTTLKPYKRFHITQLVQQLFNVFFYAPSGLLIFVYTRETFVYDVQRGSITQKMLLRGSKCSRFHGDFLFVGQSTGEVDVYEVVDRKLNVRHQSGLPGPHNQAVTGFGFSPSLWISSSLDKSVIVWNYHFEIYSRIELPEPLYACEILNGARDIVVGTDTELMLIQRDYIFEIDEVDDEIPAVDNFDSIRDPLVPERFVIAEQEKREARQAKELAESGTESVVVTTTAKKGVQSKRKAKLKELMKKHVDKWRIDPDAYVVLSKLNNESDKERENAEERARVIQEMQKMQAQSAATTAAEKAEAEMAKSAAESATESDDNATKSTNAEEDAKKRDEGDDDGGDAEHSKKKGRRKGGGLDIDNSGGGRKGQGRSQDSHGGNTSGPRKVAVGGHGRAGGGQQLDIRVSGEHEKLENGGLAGSGSADAAGKYDDDIGELSDKGGHGKGGHGKGRGRGKAGRPGTIGDLGDYSDDEHGHRRKHGHGNGHNHGHGHGHGGNGDGGGVSGGESGTGSDGRVLGKDGFEVVLSSEHGKPDVDGEVEAETAGKKGKKGKKGRNKRDGRKSLFEESVKKTETQTPTRGKRPATPPSIRPGFENDALKRLLGNKRSRSRANTRNTDTFQLPPSMNIIVDECALRESFARGKVKLEIIRGMTKSTVGASDVVHAPTIMKRKRSHIRMPTSQSPGPGSGFFHRTQSTSKIIPEHKKVGQDGAHTQKTPVNDAHIVQENGEQGVKSEAQPLQDDIQTEALKVPPRSVRHDDNSTSHNGVDIPPVPIRQPPPRLSTISIPERDKPEHYDVSEPLQRELLYPSSRVPIAARVVAYRRASSESETVDLLADAVFEHAPEVWGPATSTRVKGRMRTGNGNRGPYRSARRLKTIGPIGSLEKSVHVRRTNTQRQPLPALPSDIV